MGNVSLGAQDGEDHTKRKFAAFKTSIESILKKQKKILCTLGNPKQDIGGKVELIPIVFVMITCKRTHQNVNCFMWNSAHEMGWVWTMYNLNKKDAKAQTHI